MNVALRNIAYSRSGDKGSHANIGVIAYTKAGYEYLQRDLSAELVAEYFSALGTCEVKRYELPTLWALNFVLEGILIGGGNRSLRVDAQGKALAQALLEMHVEIDEEHLKQYLRQKDG